MEKVLYQDWRRILSLFLIAPLGAVAVTTVASKMTGLALTLFLISLCVACVITLIFHKRVGPILFGPGVGSAVVLAPILKDFGFAPAMTAIFLVGILQIIFVATGVLDKAKFLPKSLKIGITLALGMYLVHKPDVGNLFGKILEYKPDAVHLVMLATVVLFVLLACKPFLLHTRLSLRKLGISHVLVVGMIGSIMSVLLFGESSMSDNTHTITYATKPGWLSNPSYWMSFFILCFVEIVEGLFNYKSATAITKYEEPKNSLNWAFGISSIMNVFNAAIGAGPVMTGLIKVSIYEENHGGCNRRDLSIYTAGIVVMSLGHSFILQVFAQWLFAAIVLFVGLKLIVKALSDMEEIAMDAKLAAILGAGLVGFIWLTASHQLIWAILFCSAAITIYEFLKVRPVDEVEENHKQVIATLTKNETKELAEKAKLQEKSLN